MARWETGATGRLEGAALDLFRKQGFENTTVAQIAESAGLTERTFFRHFADKREVLFGGTHVLEDLLVAAVAAAPRSRTPIDAVVAALCEAEPMLDERRERAMVREQVIASNTELQERNAMKLASMSRGLTDALRERGTDDAVAALAADAGVSVFKLAFRRWIDPDNGDTFSSHVNSAVDDLRSLTIGG